jgi:acyl-CoA reductase-like NAD-dependent aldehyde dehydrogenase
VAAPLLPSYVGGAWVDAEMLGVNVGVPAPVAWFPSADWKDSCDGDLHANGTDAVDFYTRKKVATSRWQRAQTKRAGLPPGPL